MAGEMRRSILDRLLEGLLSGPSALPRQDPPFSFRLLGICFFQLITGNSHILNAGSQNKEKDYLNEERATATEGRDGSVKIEHLRKSGHRLVRHYFLLLHSMGAKGPPPSLIRDEMAYELLKRLPGVLQLPGAHLSYCRRGDEHRGVGKNSSNHPLSPS